MSSTDQVASFPPPESEVKETDLYSSSAFSSKVSSASPPKTSPPSSSSSSPPYDSKTRYFTSAAAETKDHVAEKLDSCDGKELPYTRLDEDKRYHQRLPKVNPVKKETSSGRMVTSYEDITSLRLWKAVIAEAVGTMLLTLVGCGSCINLQGEANTTSPLVKIALCFGLTVATVAWSIGHISGGHINPAVTAAMLVARKISLAKAVFYVLFQLVGAVVGAAILLGLTPEDYRGALGMTKVSDKINLVQAVGVEFFVTFVLVFTVFASCDSKRRDLNGSTPLSIGLAVTTCHLWAIDFTGSSMNTARSFGPALAMGDWDNHWVYWLGPILGGVVAGIVYEHLFAHNASLLKAKACLLSSDYDDDKYQAKRLKVRIIEEDSSSIQENDELPLTGKDETYSSNV